MEKIKNKKEGDSQKLEEEKYRKERLKQEARDAVLA